MVGIFKLCIVCLQIAHSMLAMLQASESTPTDSCQTPRIALNELLALHGLPTNQGKKGKSVCCCKSSCFHNSACLSLFLPVPATLVQLPWLFSSSMQQRHTLAQGRLPACIGLSGNIS